MTEFPDKPNQSLPTEPPPAHRFPLPCGITPSEIELFNSIFYSLDDGVAVADQSGALVYLNPGGERILGKGAQQSKPEAWSEEFGLFCEDMKTPVPAEELPLAVALRGRTVTGRHLYTRNEMMLEGIHISVNASPLWNDKREVAGAIAVFRNITDLVVAKDQLREHAMELTRSNSELEKFAYIASHDLKEPLRMVSNYVRLLQRRFDAKLDETGREFIGFAIDGAERMYAMIDALLEYSRLAYRSREVQSVEMALVLQTAQKNLQTAIADSGAIFHLPAELPTVSGNPHRLLQLFQNLISNAIKFKTDQTPEVWITCEAQGARWLFRVRDNGIGVDPQFHERIFEIFQRIHSRDQYPGNGIGLSICKKIVESYGGQMWIESALGQGSTFAFTLPRYP